MAKGVPEKEIAFIHNANTEARKTELFAKVRSGQVRFLLGSTAKMGAGTNVQDRLIALHHLDVPWRPSDIEQQEGRILRQGNMNDRVKIFRYITENTFDSYSWQIIENKQKFIGQIMTSKSPVRSCEDVDEAALTYAEVKALATGNPYIKEKMDLDIQVSKLKLMKANHISQKYHLEDNITKYYPQQIAALKERITGLQADIQTAQLNYPQAEQFSMKVGNKVYRDKKEAGAALVELCKQMKSADTSSLMGEYAGFRIFVSFNSLYKRFEMNLKGRLSHKFEIGSDPLGNITRMNHVLESMTKGLDTAEVELENVGHQLETAKKEMTKPFVQEEELAKKLERLTKLNALLNMDEKNDDLEKGGESMDLSELDGLWNDSNDGEKQPEADSMIQKDVILVDVVHNDEHRYFRYENIGLEEIKEQLRHTDRPMIDLTGELMTLPEFAQLEQSSKVSLSLTINMDDRTIQAYETNNIPEDLRTDDNISIKTYPMDEYLNDRKVPKKEKSSVIDRLHQNQKKIQDSKATGQEPVHRNHETVK